MAFFITNVCESYVNIIVPQPGMYIVVCLLSNCVYSLSAY